MFTFGGSSDTRPRGLHQLPNTFIRTAQRQGHCGTCQGRPSSRMLRGQQRHELAAIRRNGSKGRGRHTRHEKLGGIQMLLLPTSCRSGVTETAYDSRCKIAHAARVNRSGVCFGSFYSLRAQRVGNTAAKKYGGETVRCGHAPSAALRMLWERRRWRRPKQPWGTTWPRCHRAQRGWTGAQRSTPRRLLCRRLRTQRRQQGKSAELLCGPLATLNRRKETPRAARR